jgi:hypothetical protein
MTCHIRICSLDKYTNRLDLDALESLAVEDCALLTDDAARALATHCAGLTALNATRCALLTDDAVGALARGCAALARLELEGQR